MGAAYKPKNTILTVKYSSDSIIIWGHFSEKGTEALHVMSWSDVLGHIKEEFNLIV